MGKRSSFDAAQLPNHQWGIPDVYNAYPELDREEAVNDMCEVDPRSGAMSISLYTMPTVYIHASETRTRRNTKRIQAPSKVATPE